MLTAAGFRVLSEESGLSGAGTGPLVVIDPLDGSTNFSRGVPWYATALCLVDGDGPAVALVANQASGERFAAVRGEGAWRATASPLTPSGCTSPAAAIVGISGPPAGAYGWAQFRALGASALDLCLVAAGTLDAYVDMSTDAHGVWDYLAATLDLRRGRRRRRRRAWGASSSRSTTRPGARRSGPRPPRCSTRCSASGRRRELDGAGDAQHGVLAPAAADDLQPDRQAGVRRRGCGRRTAPTPRGTARPC